MNDHVLIEDGSGDKKYFTIIPNFIINHSTAIDQALYLNMKRYAGETGLCYASEKTLMKNMSIGRHALKKSVKYLIEHKWITLVGHQRVETQGGIQSVKAYKVNDIWKMNTEYYKGVSKSSPPKQRGANPSTKGVLIQPTKKNKEKEEQIFENSEELKQFHSDFMERLRGKVSAAENPTQKPRSKSKNTK
jgi:hypothetical protein